MTQQIERVSEEVLAEIETRTNDITDFLLINTDEDYHVLEVKALAMYDDLCKLLAEVRALRAKMAELEAKSTIHAVVSPWPNPATVPSVWILP